MSYIYIRFICSCLVLSICFQISGNHFRAIRSVKQYARPALKYGLPLLPIAYLAIREGINRLSRLRRVEESIKEVHNELESFRKETQEDFSDTKDELKVAKKEILHKVVKTKKALQNLIMQTDEHLEEVEAHIRGDIKDLKSDVGLQLKTLEEAIAECATKKQVQALDRKLDTIITEIRNYAARILGAIQETEERLKKYVEDVINEHDEKERQRFENLSKENEERVGRIVCAYTELHENGNREIRTDIKCLSDKVGVVENNVTKKIREEGISLSALFNNRLTDQEKRLAVIIDERLEKNKKELSAIVNKRLDEQTEKITKVIQEEIEKNKS